MRLLERVRKDLDAVGLVEQFPKLEGRQMVMVLAPKKKGVPPAKKPKAPKAAPDKPKPSRRSCSEARRQARQQVMAAAFEAPAHSGAARRHTKREKEQSMPKMKTKSGAAKRFRCAAAARIKRGRRLQAPHPHQEDHQEQAPPARAAARSTTPTRRRSVPCCRTRRKERAMPRVKRGVTARARHKKVLKQAKGFRGRRKNVFRIAKQAVMKAGQYAYRDRRNKKREFRALWIARINAAVRELGMTYSAFMNGPEARREHRHRPQGAGRPRRARQGGVCQDRGPGQSQPRALSAARSDEGRLAATSSGIVVATRSPTFSAASDAASPREREGALPRQGRRAHRRCSRP